MSSQETDISDFKARKKLTYKPPKYTRIYRWVKSSLLLLTWVSFGINFELIGITLEDLKIFLNVNYASISLGPVLRNTGYLCLTLVLGVFLDKISKYSELLMAGASALIALTSFLMPITKSYFMSMVYFLVQGFSQSIYDLTGISIIINLWKAVPDSSPINALQSSYGLGACFSQYLAKPYITYHRLDVLTTSHDYPMETNSSFSIDQESSFQINSTIINNLATDTLISANINLRYPYWFSATIAAGLAICFLVAQLVEDRRNKENDINKRNYMLLMEDTDSDNEISSAQSSRSTGSRYMEIFQELFFSDERYRGKLLGYMIIQICLFLLFFLFIQGSFTIISRLMFTYLIRGPARFNTDEFELIESIFWGCINISRFLAIFLATKFKPVKFLLTFIIINTFASFLFLVPFLVNHRSFFWVFVPLLGFLSGPIMPCGLMLAKKFLDFNSFILSLFIAGLALGGIIFQELGGYFLDQARPNTDPTVIIPVLTFLSNLLALITFLLISCLYRRFNLALRSRIDA